MTFTIGTRVRWTCGGKKGVEGVIVGFSPADLSRPIVRTDAGRVHGQPHGITPSNLEPVTGDPGPVAAEPVTTTPVVADLPPPIPGRPGDRARERMRDTLTARIADFNRRLEHKLENTPKRLAQGMVLRRDLAQHERALAILLAQPEGAPIPPLATLMGAAMKVCVPVSNGYHGYSVDGPEWWYNDPASVALRAHLPAQDAPPAPDLKLMLAKLKFADIPGFFPTPPLVVERMMQLADIKPGMQCLEPSAGIGDIADAMRDAGGNVCCIELNHDLEKVLTAKGHASIQADFLEFPKCPEYARVVMNPPFERAADIVHVLTAWEWLKPGGRLVACMSASTATRTDAKTLAFHEWANVVGAELEELPEDSFNGRDAFRQTGVRAILLTATKPTPGTTP